MKKAKREPIILVFIAGVILFSVTLFSLCYFFDNKYTADGPQAANGILELHAGTLRNYPAFFLTHGWELYRGKLLAPEDFHANPRPDEFTFIGQYGGFEGGDKAANPHGSATYRLNILIPPEPALYMLELPEIYSAYTLYINGVKAEQFGEPDPAGYLPQTGNGSASFLARSRIEVIVAVSDFSHMYSGMVYPPAFGVAAAVQAMIQTRLTIRAAVCAVGLALAIFFLIVGFLMGKNRQAMHFGAVCLCFVGYTCYPVVKTLFRSGLAWYGFENLCFCAMLFLVMLLSQSVSGKSRLSKPFIILGVSVCVCSAARSVIVTSDLRVLEAYSLLIGLYKWAAAFFLTVNTLRSVRRDTQYGLTMLCGILVFDCGLAMDRLLPQFEPILFGWFAEIGGFAVVAALGVVIGQELLRQYRDKQSLEGKISGIEKIVEMQRAYYPVILEGIEDTRRARHDLRHHMRVIREFVSSGQYAQLDEYLHSYGAGVSSAPPLTYCENDVVDVILRHFDVLAKKENVRFQADAIVPSALPIDSADLCGVISNLLENALEACAYVGGDKWIAVTIKEVRGELVLLVENSFDGYLRLRGDTPLSRKRRNREGSGLLSVRKTADKYSGSADFRPDARTGVFYSEVFLKNL